MDFLEQNSLAIVTLILTGLSGAFATWLFTRTKDAKNWILQRRVKAHEEMLEFAKYLRMVADTKAGEESYPKMLVNKQSYDEGFNWFVRVIQKNDHWFRGSVRRESLLLLKYLLGLKPIVHEQKPQALSLLRSRIRPDFALFSLRIERRCMSYFQREALKRWWAIPGLRRKYTKRTINKRLAATKLYENTVPEEASDKFN